MKRIIITGGSDGLGLKFTTLCLSKGIQVVNLSRHKPEIDDIYINKELLIHLETDLANEQSIINATTIIKEKYPTFSALINCAGIISIQEANAITYNELETLIKINTIAPIFLTSQLFDLIQESEADIINVGSTIGTKQGRPNQCAYTTSKWGLRGTSQNLQLELTKTKCRVIQLNIGGMNTRMHEKKYSNEKIENPAERMDPHDVAELMFYLLQLPKLIEVSEITINRKK